MEKNKATRVKIEDLQSTLDQLFDIINDEDNFDFGFVIAITNGQQDNKVSTTGAFCGDPDYIATGLYNMATEDDKVALVITTVAENLLKVKK